MIHGKLPVAFHRFFNPFVRPRPFRRFNHRQKDIDPATLPRLSVTYELPPPQVTPVTYPPAGANLDSAFTRVLGTHDGPANTGVTVNGAPALVYNGQFAAIVPLQA